MNSPDENRFSRLKSDSYSGYRAFSYLRANVDYASFELAPEFGRVPLHVTELDEAQVERVVRLLSENIVISLHEHPQRFPIDMSELEAFNRAGRPFTAYAGLASSGLTVVFDNMIDGTGCIMSKSGWSWDDVVYDLGMRLCDLAHQNFARHVRNLGDIAQVHEDGSIGVVMSLEAATPIGNEIDRLDVLYGLGVRQIGIAYSESNMLGGGLKELRDGGLTVLGRRAVERMNALGLAIDISHSGDRTCLDTIEESSKPVLITHAGARTVWRTPRMKPDDVLKACAARGGLVGIEAAPHTTLSAEHPRHSIESVMDHFSYCVELLGIEHVAFGPDTIYGDHVALHRALNFDPGLGGEMVAVPFESVDYVAGLENPTENFFNIVSWLVRHGYSDEEIVLAIGGNVMRVLADIWN